MNTEPDPFEPGDDPLPMWTVYDHPSDYPSNYVARESFVNQNGVNGYGGFIICSNLDWLRIWLQQHGLVCIGRMPGDDPKIVEVWI